MTMMNEMVSFLTDMSLRRGATGSSVKTLQTLLNYRGAGLTVDSVFGEKTETCIIEFQQAVGLVADGIVGLRTWNMIRAGMVVSRIPDSLINVREAPNRTSAVVQVLEAGENIRILGRSTILTENYHWFEVEAKETLGWVREDLVRLYSPFTIPLPVANGVTVQLRPRPWFMEIDPSIEAVIRDALEPEFCGLESENRPRIRYIFQPLDLNCVESTGITLVYLMGSQVCGTGGCTMLVLQSTAIGYELISRISAIQQPVIVSNQQTNGCPDLIVYTAGGGLAPAYRRLRFNGSTYPTNPTMEPTLPAGTTITSGVAFASRITPALAAPLVPM